MYSSSRTLKVSHNQPVPTGEKELVLRVTTYLGSKLADRFDAEHSSKELLQTHDLVKSSTIEGAA